MHYNAANLLISVTYMTTCRYQYFSEIPHVDRLGVDTVNWHYLENHYDFNCNM